MSEAFERELRTRASGTHVLPDGEYVEWTRDASRASLIWSSDKSLPDLILAADKVLGSADSEHRGLVDFGDIPSAPVTAEEARQRALYNPHEVTFLRLEYASGIALVWTPTAGTDALETHSDFAEASVSFDRKHAKLASKAIALTATRSIVKDAGIIAESVAAQI